MFSEHDPDDIRDLTVAVPVSPKLVNLLVGDRRRLTVDLEAERDHRRDRAGHRRTLLGECDLVIADPERSCRADVRGQAHSASLLRLHGDRNELADLTVELGATHGFAQLQIAAEHRRGVRHRRDHVSDLAVPLDEIAEQVS
nr:hypothetical protein [Micrococcus sp. CH3]